MEAALAKLVDSGESGQGRVASWALCRGLVSKMSYGLRLRCEGGVRGLRFVRVEASGLHMLGSWLQIYCVGNVVCGRRKVRLFERRFADIRRG
jgi:hypothetical protein